MKRNGGRQFAARRMSRRTVLGGLGAVMSGAALADAPGATRRPLLRPKTLGPATALDGAAWIVDALLGTGARGNPRSPYDGVISEINGQATPVVSVDVPSGLDCN
ncbi:MAG: NAD(P)H-hydrate epimerase, partial [Paracoccaceae bacterium]